VQSSPPYASLRLELPPVTFADRATCVLVVLAGGFAAMELAARARPGMALLAAGLAIAVAVTRALFWTQSRFAPATVLERVPDGTLRVRMDGRPAAVATLGTGTRTVGASVYLEFDYPVDRRRTRCRRWLTPLDVPAEMLRRWMVVLPGSGRVARS
jgi:hypothetical protein